MGLNCSVADRLWLLLCKLGPRVRFIWSLANLLILFPALSPNICRFAEGCNLSSVAWCLKLRTTVVFWCLSFYMYIWSSEGMKEKQTVQTSIFSQCGYFCSTWLLHWTNINPRSVLDYQGFCESCGGQTWWKSVFWTCNVCGAIICFLWVFVRMHLHEFYSAVQLESHHVTTAA